MHRNGSRIPASFHAWHHRALRAVSGACLQACLVLVEKRETRYRVQWYYKLFEQTMRGMARDQRSGAMPSADSIHGSLVALGELLQHTGEFLLARSAAGLCLLLCDWEGAPGCSSNAQPTPHADAAARDSIRLMGKWPSVPCCRHLFVFSHKGTRRGADDKQL